MFDYCSVNYTVGMLLQLKRDTPEFSALKRYEKELIRGLKKADMVALTESAVELNLVPLDTVWQIDSLDLSTPHALLCRYLFSHVYTTILKSSAADPYERWLGLLSELRLPEVSFVLSRLKQHHLSMATLIASRASLSSGSGGDRLLVNDIPLLTQALTKYKDHGMHLKKLICSLLFENCEVYSCIEHLRLAACDALRAVLTAWITKKFPDAKPPTLACLEKALCSDMVGCGQVAAELRDNLQKVATRLSGLLLGSPLCEKDVPVLLELLHECTKKKGKIIAHALLLPKTQPDDILGGVRGNTFECLRQVLTPWIQKQYSGCKPPTLENFESVLSNALVGLKHVAANLRKNLMKNGADIRILEGGELKESDISLLIRVLDDCCDKWKEIGCSLLLLDSEAEAIVSIMHTMSPDECLKKVFTMCIQGRFEKACPLTLACLEKVLSSDIVGLKQVADHVVEGIKNRVQCLIDSIRKGNQFNDICIHILSDTLFEITDMWEPIAYCLLLPDDEMKKVEIISLAEENNISLTTYLNQALTLWLNNELPNTKAPTLETFINELERKCFNRDAFITDLIKEAINCKASSEVMHPDFTVTPSSDLLVPEGKCVLLEVQVSHNMFDNVTFRWLHNENPINESTSSVCCVQNSYYGSGVGLLCLAVDGLAVDGVYRCIVEQNLISLKSQPIVLKIITPVDRHRQNLCDFYMCQDEVPKDTWPPVVKQSYINLALIKDEDIFQAGVFGRTTIRGTVDDIYSDKNSVIHEKVFDKLESGARMLVEGRPGSGKTCLMHKISHDWAKGTLFFQHNRLLFLVHLRAFLSDPKVGLSDILKCYYHSNSIIETIIEYAEKHGGLGLCFILDGLDEYMPNRPEANIFIFRLIRRKIFPKATIIIASRPAAAANFRSVATTHIEVIGFLRNEIFDYVRKYPFADKSKTEEICMFLEEHPNVLHSCYLPIQSAMVCFLFEALGAALPHTETEIYQEFTKYTILRSLFREGECEMSYLNSLQDLPEPQKELYNQICKLAFEMTISSQQVTKQDTVQNFFLLKHGEKESLGLVTVDRTAAKCGFFNLYTFLHLTFQEFLAAHHITMLMESEQIKLVEQYCSQKQMQQVWKFYCGLADFSDTGIKFSALISNTKHYSNLYQIQCCFESQQPHLCDIVVEGNTLSFKDPFLTPSNFTEIAFIVSNTEKNHVEELSFDSCMFEKEGSCVLVNKSGDALRRVTRLRFHKIYDTQQLEILCYFAVSMPSLKLLDISYSQLEMAEIQILCDHLIHPSLEILKVGSPRNILYHSEVLQLKLVRALLSNCSKFVNILFWGANEWAGLSENKWPLPCYVHCKPPHLSFTSAHLGLTVINALSSEVVFNNTLYTTVTLSNCGINDILVCSLCLGLMCCSSLRLLDLSFNSIGNVGAKKLSETVPSCSKLSVLDVTFNQLEDEGALELVKVAKELKGLDILITCDKISKFADILALQSGTQFHTLNKSHLGDKGTAKLASILLSCNKIAKELLELYLDNNSISIFSLKPLCNVLSKCHNLVVLDLSYNSLNAESAVYLSESLKHCTKLHKLDVSSNNLGSKGIVTIAEGLEGSRYLLQLNVSSNNIDSSGAVGLAKALIHCTSLQELHIGSNYIGCEGMEALADTMKHWTTFFSLDISSNSIPSEGAKALAGVLQSTTWACFNSLNISIGSKGAKVLVEALKTIPTFRGLSIGGNDLQNEGIAYISTSFKNHMLSALDITSNSGFGTKTKKLVKYLKCCNSPQLQKLCIASNHISASDMKTILDTLAANCSKHHRKLCVLDISKNATDLGADCFGVLASILKNSGDHFQELNVQRSVFDHHFIITQLFPALCFCPNLHTLNLAESDIRSEGLKTLCESLAKCTTLTSLNLSSNDIDESGVVALKPIIPTIQVLDFDYNPIGDGGAETLASMLMQCRARLTTLRVVGNRIGRNGAKKLIEAIQSCIHFTTIEIYFNSIGDECCRMLNIDETQWKNYR